MADLLAPDFVAEDLSFEIAKAQTIVMRAPIETPVETSFGIMRDRPALFLRLEDCNGNTGLGETWCNFPACGAEHRERLLQTAILPALIGTEFAGPQQCFERLQERFRRLAIQSGEPGPVAQCLAAVDIAIWDLVARRLDIPLFRLLGGSSATIGAYASGINPDGALESVARCRAKGFGAFKLKLGFGRETDLDNLGAIASGLKPDETLMTDANQAWSPEEAERYILELHAFPIAWLEEPIAADAEEQEWMKLARNDIPLAAGENFRGADDFAAAIAGDWLTVVQPDLCKWGGFSGALPVAHAALAAGKRFCPHFLGGGIGLAASAHLLAAAGGDGLLEIDSNPNPLRQQLFAPPVTDGQTTVPELPGIGIDPSKLERLAEFKTAGTVL